MRSEVAGADRVNQRSALDQFIARGRQEQALRLRPDPVAGAADPLQRDRDPAGRADLAHQVDRPDIDAKFERCSRDHGAQFARFEPRFGIQPQLARETSMMRKHDVFAEPLA